MQCCNVVLLHVPWAAVVLYCHTAVVLYCHTAVVLYCHTAVVLYCHTAVVLYCHTAVVLYCHTAAPSPGDSASHSRAAASQQSSRIVHQPRRQSNQRVYSRGCCGQHDFAHKPCPCSTLQPFAPACISHGTNAYPTLAHPALNLSSTATARQRCDAAASSTICPPTLTTRVFAESTECVLAPTHTSERSLRSSAASEARNHCTIYG
jgi:hypothetical protein